MTPDLENAIIDSVDDVYNVYRDTIGDCKMVYKTLAYNMQDRDGLVGWLRGLADYAARMEGKSAR